jgi:hypothetical protein
MYFTTSNKSQMSNLCSHLSTPISPTSRKPQSAKPISKTYSLFRLKYPMAIKPMKYLAKLIGTPGLLNPVIFQLSLTSVRNIFTPASTVDDLMSVVVNQLFKNQLEAWFKDVFVGWQSVYKIAFLNEVLVRVNSLNKKAYLYMRDILGLHDDYSLEVSRVWYQIALVTGHQDVVPYAINFLRASGRLELIRPVYAAWAGFNREQAYLVFTSLQ